MAELVIKLFTKNKNISSPSDRRNAYGTACGILGIFLNVLLFVMKLFVGLLSGSMAITADAFNNLADAGSSVVTLFGFRLAAKKPDPEHPFGHGRMEYLSALAVSALIILMGVELIRSSAEKLLAPQSTELSIVASVILAVSVLVKIYMSAYNKKYGKQIDSSAMLATATDSLSDAVSTGVVLIAGLISTATSNPYIDPICGIAVAIFILRAGICAAKDTVSPLLGQPPKKEFVDKIEALVMASPMILGIHDMVVHDYGPGRVMVSLHAEVSCHEDILAIHDVIDNTENLIFAELGCEAVIHMDPIDTENAKTSELRAKLAEIAASIDSELKFHDFRVVHGRTHTNLLFDILLPVRLHNKEAYVTDEIKRQIGLIDESYRCIIKVDRAYT
ncbi:MAG: cation transporter [Clostridia bacterium]|nr:cation transporter [Clostridia bacterium]